MSDKLRGKVAIITGAAGRIAGHVDRPRAGHVSGQRRHSESLETNIRRDGPNRVGDAGDAGFQQLAHQRWTTAIRWLGGARRRLVARRGVFLTAFSRQLSAISFFVQRPSIRLR